MILNKNWLLEPYEGMTPNKFTYGTINEQYAVDQILLNGHYLYALNTEFRKDYLDSFGCELTLVGKDQVDFLYKNKFNILYFGLLAAPYLIAQGNSPSFYLERCNPDNSAELSKFLADETQKLHRPIQAKPGMPFYYYKVSKTKFFVNSLTHEVEHICPAKGMLTKAIEYAKLLQKDAQLVMNELAETESIRLNEFMETLRDESWSPFLYGKK